MASKFALRVFQDWLKPGGRLLISDYCCTEDPWSDVYTAYVKQRGYHLLSVQQYGKVRSDPGFLEMTDTFFLFLTRRTVSGLQCRVCFMQTSKSPMAFMISMTLQESLVAFCSCWRRWGLPR